MDEAKAKELIGKPILIALSSFADSTIYRAEIKQISPSGKFIEIKIEEEKPFWRRLSEKIYFLEELPEEVPRVRIPTFSIPDPPPPPPLRILDPTTVNLIQKLLKFFKFI